MKLRPILIKSRESTKFEDAFDMKDFLKSCGFKSGEHQGRDESDFDGDDKMIVEWFIGQAISMLEKNELYGMNSWFNCIERFVPEDYEIMTDYFDEELFHV